MFAWELAARTISEGPQRSLRILHDNLRLQDVTRDYVGRPAYNLSLHLPLSVLYLPSSFWQEGLRADLWCMIAPDLVRKSRMVDIRQDYYGIFSGLSWSYVRLFRYSLSLAPGVWMQETKGKVLEHSLNYRQYVSALMFRSAVDYAPSDWLEFSLSLSSFRRFSPDLWDWSYGFGVNINV